MKRLLFFVVGVVMFLFGCNKTTDTGGTIIEVDEEVFKKLKSCEELDDECAYILKAKQAVDDTRLKLIKYEEGLKDISKLNDKEEFTKCIYWLLGITTSLDESQNIFKTHIIYLSEFFNKKQQNSESKFLKFKYDLLTKNASIIETGKPVLTAQENYKKANENFYTILQEVLKLVEMDDLEGAAALLNSEDAIAQRKTSIELMNALYKFECARARSVLDICGTYSEIY